MKKSDQVKNNDGYQYYLVRFSCLGIKGYMEDAVYAPSINEAYNTVKGRKYRGDRLAANGWYRVRKIHKIVSLDKWWQVDSKNVIHFMDEINPMFEKDLKKYPCPES